MGRKCIQIKKLHGYTIKELQNKTNQTDSEYTRNLLLTVIMRYKALNAEVVMDTLGKARSTIVRYVKKWNESPENIID